MKQRYTAYLPLSVLGCLVTTAASAATFERLPTAGSEPGLFDEASQWMNLTTSQAGVPGKTDTALFIDTTGSQVVYLGDNQATERLYVAGGDWLLESEDSGAKTYSIESDGSQPGADVDVSGGSLRTGVALGPLHIVASEGFLSIGDSGDGSILLFQDGAHLEMGGQSRSHVIGDNGFDGSLTVSSAAKATIGVDGTLDIASSNSDFTTGSVTVSAGGALNTGTLSIANRNSDATGTLYVGGGGSIVTQSSGSGMNLGSLIGGAGQLTIATGGQFNSGSGAQNINHTGTLTVGGGVYNANGTIVLAPTGVLSVQGGEVNARAGLNNTMGGTIDLQTGRLSVTGGAFIPRTSAAFVYDPGSINAEFEIGAGGSADLDDGFTAESGRFTLVEGALLTSSQAAITGAEVVLSDAGTDWSVSGGLSLAAPTGVASTSVAVRAGAQLEVVGRIDVGGLGLTSFSSAEHELVVTGPASRLDAGSFLYLGQAAKALLRVDDQGVADVDGFLRVTANGTAEVDGAGSRLVVASHTSISSSSGGDQGMRVTNQGEADFTDLTVSGFSDGSDPLMKSGRLNVDGGSVSVSGLFEVGGTTKDLPETSIFWDSDRFGRGEVSVANGGLLTTSTTQVAATPSGENNLSSGVSAGVVTLSGPATRWRNTGALTVGGTATQDGGAGHVTVTDDATLEVEGVFHVRVSGTVQLTGGTLRMDSTALINAGHLELRSGVVSLSNAEGYTVGLATGDFEDLVGSERVILPAEVGLAVERTLVVPAARSVSVADAVLSGESIKNQGLVTAINSSVGAASGITNEGDLVLVDSVVDGELSNEGRVTVLGSVEFSGLVSGGGGFYGPGKAVFSGGLAPGSSPAVTTVEGDLALAASNTLYIELGGTTPGAEHDRVEVTGVATLGGDLEVTLIDDFSPSLGDNYGFLSASGGIASAFSTISLPDLTGRHLDWQVNPGGATLFLEVVPALAGDFNLDGLVDAADYTVWRDGLGSTFNQGDYTVWSNNYGAVAASPTRLVPEPAAGLLAVLAAVVPRLRSGPLRSLAKP